MGDTQRGGGRLPMGRMIDDSGTQGPPDENEISGASGIGDFTVLPEMLPVGGQDLTVQQVAPRTQTRHTVFTTRPLRISIVRTMCKPSTCMVYRLGHQIRARTDGGVVLIWGQ